MGYISSIGKAVYVGIASTFGSERPHEDRRAFASWVMAMASFSLVLTSSIAIHDAFSVDVLGWLTAFWPWSAEEHGRMIGGLPVLLGVFAPLLVAWARLGYSWRHQIPHTARGFLSDIVVFSWFMLTFPGGVIAAIRLGGFVAVGSQLVLFLLLHLWFKLTSRL